jgi:hypothetical protein
VTGLASAAVTAAAERIVDRRMRVMHWGNAGLETHRAALMAEALADATAALEAAAPHTLKAGMELVFPEVTGRESLGALVREVWIEWAQEQPEPKPSWLTPWGELDEGQREVDMRIGATVAAVAGAAERERIYAELGNDHYVIFSPDRWTIEHSVDCRLSGRMHECDYHEAVVRIAYEFDPGMGGRWRIDGIDSKGLPSLVRVDPTGGEVP